MLVNFNHLEFKVQLADLKVAFDENWESPEAVGIASLVLNLFPFPFSEANTGKQSLWRVENKVSDPYPAFFLPIATTSNKKF
jgi:hypothetical protein